MSNLTCKISTMLLLEWIIYKIISPSQIRRTPGRLDRTLAVPFNVSHALSLSFVECVRLVPWFQPYQVNEITAQIIKEEAIQLLKFLLQQVGPSRARSGIYDIYTTSIKSESRRNGSQSCTEGGQLQYPPNKLQGVKCQRTVTVISLWQF